MCVIRIALFEIKIIRIIIFIKSYIWYYLFIIQLIIYDYRQWRFIMKEIKFIYMKEKRIDKFSFAKR